MHEIGTSGFDCIHHFDHFSVGISALQVLLGVSQFEC